MSSSQAMSLKTSPVPCPLGKHNTSKESFNPQTGLQLVRPSQDPLPPSPASPRAGQWITKDISSKDAKSGINF